MNSDLVHKIVALFHGGASMRRIAQSLGVSRRTVSKALAQVERARGGGPVPRPKAARGSLLDAYEPAIAELLARYPDITVQRVHEELHRLGYTGGYTILSERVRRLRPRPAAAPVRRFETSPGEQAQMDYSTYDIEFTDEGRRRVHAFSYVLGYSRRQYLHFVEAQDFATTSSEGMFSSVLQAMAWSWAWQARSIPHIAMKASGTLSPSVSRPWLRRMQ